MNTILEKIKKITGREVTSCSCELCRNQCKTPCLGTPDDILNLIDAGYADKLDITFWVIGLMERKVPFPIPMVQAKVMEDGCIFFKHGLCELHDNDLKPTEGKLSHHYLRVENFVFEMSLSWLVAREWIVYSNFETIERIFHYMGYELNE